MLHKYYMYNYINYIIIHLNRNIHLDINMYYFIIFLN